MAGRHGLPQLAIRAPQAFIDRVQARADKAGSNNRTEVVMSALKLYLYLAPRMDDGAVLALIERDENGRKVVRELVFPE